MRRFASPAGSRRTRVTFQRLKSTATLDAAGHFKEHDSAQWETYCSRWAAIKYGNGRESLTGDQLTAASGVQLVVPSDSVTRAINTAMRVTFDSRTLGISSPPVDVYERRREVLIQCVEAKHD